MTDDPLAWLVPEGAEEAVERPQEAISGRAESEGEAWVSPARLVLQERADRNRHTTGCNCQRCAPLVHGAYEAEPDTRDLAAAIHALLPADHPADVVAVELLAVALTRVRRAMDALSVSDHDGRLEDSLRLAKDARGWLAHAERLCERLGLTPTSRASLGLAEAETVRHRVAALMGAVDVSRWSDEELESVVRLLEKATPQEPGQ